MFLSSDTARSDFFLVSAILLFGPFLVTTLSGFIPSQDISYWMRMVMVPGLLLGVPVWLQRVRNQPISDLWRGSPKDLFMGAICALPVVLAVLANTFSSGGVLELFGGMHPVLLVVRWLVLAVAIAFLIQRAEVAFGGNSAPASYVSSRMFGVLIGLGVLCALGYVFFWAGTTGNVQGIFSAMATTLWPIGAGAAWLLAERVIGLEGNVQKNAWYTVGVIIFLANVDILSLITNISGFVVQLIILGPLGALTLISLAAWETKRSVLFGYGVALVYGLASVPSISVVN